MMEMIVYIELAAQIVGVAAMIAAIVPHAKPAAPILFALRKALDVLAMNIGNAKNKEKQE